MHILVELVSNQQGLTNRGPVIRRVTTTKQEQPQSNSHFEYNQGNKVLSCHWPRPPISPIITPTKPLLPVLFTSPTSSLFHYVISHSICLLHASLTFTFNLHRSSIFKAAIRNQVSITLFTSLVVRAIPKTS